MSQAGTARQLEEDPVKARRAEGPGVAALQFCRGGAGSRKERHGAQSPPSSGSGARSFWKFPHQAETRSSSPERSLGS